MRTYFQYIYTPAHLPPPLLRSSAPPLLRAFSISSDVRESIKLDHVMCYPSTFADDEARGPYCDHAMYIPGPGAVHGRRSRGEGGLQWGSKEVLRREIVGYGKYSTHLYACLDIVKNEGLSVFPICGSRSYVIRSSRRGIPHKFVAEFILSSNLILL